MGNLSTQNFVTLRPNFKKTCNATGWHPPLRCNVTAFMDGPLPVFLKNYM
jgi:hypothetical protein